MQRSVYAKGFPATEKDGETQEEREAIRATEGALQKKLEQWVQDLNVGKAAALRMRREDKPGVDGKPAIKGKGRFKVRFLPLCTYPYLEKSRNAHLFRS
jgi:hypothetical protein